MIIYSCTRKYTALACTSLSTRNGLAIILLSNDAKDIIFYTLKRVLLIIKIFIRLKK